MDFNRFQSSTVFLLVAIYLLIAGVSTAGPVGEFTPIIRYPGDVDVLAVLHFRETITDDFRCSGSFNDRAPYDVEALRFALNRTNAVLNDYKVGLTVVDACGSPAVAVREVVRVLSGSVDEDELPLTGPTIGILVPGVGEVTRAILEDVTRVLDIPTIGYFPTEERFLMSDGVESGMRVTGSVGVNVPRGDIPGIGGGGDPPTPPPAATTKPISANGSPETELQSTNVVGVSTGTPQPNSSSARSNSSMDPQTPAIVLASETMATNNGDIGVSEMPVVNSTIQSDNAANTTSRGGTSRGYDTTYEGSSTSNALGDGDAMGDDDTEDGIFLLTSAVPLDSEASVLTTVLKSANWFKVGVFYSGYGTGPSRRNTFIKSAEEEGICVSFEESIPRGLTQEMSDRIIRNLINSSDPVEVLVWIVTLEELEFLLRSIRLVPVKFRGVGVFSGITETFNAFLQEEDEDSIFIDDLQFDRNPGYLEYIEERISEYDINCWLNFTLNELDTRNTMAREASHTSSLIRAIEMLACGFNDSLSQTEEPDEGLSTSTTDIRNAILRKNNFKDITKMYGVYLVSSSSLMQIANVSGELPVLSLEEYELPDAYRADGCICLASGLTLAEEDENPWTHGFRDPWIPVIFCVSVVFGLWAFVLFFAFIFFSQRPVVKKTTLLANLFLLVGIMLMYFINLFYTRVPTKLSCGFRQFGTAFIYAWVFSALLVKSMAAMMNLRKPDYDISDEPIRNKLSPFAQLSAFFSFLAPQIALSVQWIAFSPPEVVSDPDVCGSLECAVSNVSISISMIYVFVLVLVTCILSICRLSEDSLMNESRSLFLSSASTIFFLIGWIVAFTVADPIYNIPAICIGVTANATVILLACFGPACCVLTYGNGTKLEAGEEDANGDIAYINPAMTATSEYLTDDDVRTML